MAPTPDISCGIRTSFPILAAWSCGEPLLRHALRRLPGRKFVFSNAPVHYARAVLKMLGIDGMFDAVFSIERVHFRPKPDVYGFLRLCRTHHLRPRRCIMVEDSLENLRTAKRLGMKTVWVSAAKRVPGYVDTRISGITQLPDRAATLY